MHGGLTLKLRTSKFFPYYQHTRVRLRVSSLSNCCAKGKVFFAMWTIQPADYSSLSRQTNSFSQKVLLLLGCHRRTLIRRCYKTNLNVLGLRPRGHHFHSSPLVALCKYSSRLKHFSMLIMIFIYLHRINTPVNKRYVEIQIRTIFALFLKSNEATFYNNICLWIPKKLWTLN